MGRGDQSSEAPFDLDDVTRFSSFAEETLLDPPVAVGKTWIFYGDTAWGKAPDWFYDFERRLTQKPQAAESLIKHELTSDENVELWIRAGNEQKATAIFLHLLEELRMPAFEEWTVEEHPN